mmetsp:Transcript_13418/g.46764  ORF Transcript_13418/g.46764 Transcript_13418/m.46764 type:complete len:546 (+) Transcript_13418:170-1807(+)
MFVRRRQGCYFGLCFLLCCAVLVKAKEHDPLKAEEAKAAKAEQEMLKTSPLVSRTEDALIMAGGEVRSIQAQIADSQKRLKQLKSSFEEADESIHHFDKLREKDDLKLSDKQATLTRATELVNKARSEGRSEIRDRMLSEANQERGVAMERPAAVLLADSKKMDAQSNTVLHRSKSTQAKSLAALDLTMAQGLAEKASAGMRAAKVYFGRAIGEREDAVKAAGQAAKDVVDAASVSLAGNKGEEERRVLKKVVGGEEHGKQAMKDILAADGKAVDQAERQLGKVKQEVSSSKHQKGKLSDRMLLVQEHIDQLHQEFHAAQAQVVAAAKAHVLASKKLEEATAANLRAQTQLDKMRKEEVDTLKRELKEAQGAQLQSSSKFEEASRKLQGITGRRTALEVQISRLKLELQREKMKKEDEVNKAKTTDLLNKRLERTLEEEKVALKEAKLELAMKGKTLSDQEGGRGRSEDDEQEAAKGTRQEEDEDEDDGSYHSALAKEMKRQKRMEEEQQVAVHSAHEEAANIAKAQEEVEKQLEQVNALQGSHS